MKKIVLYLILGLLASSCTGEKSKEDLIKDNIISYMSDKINDPDSFEFVEMLLIDSIKYIDNINYRKEYFMDDNKFNRNMADASSDRETYLKKIEQNNSILQKIDSLKSAMGDRINDIVAYKYILKYRAKNAMGAKILVDAYMLVSDKPEYKIIQITDNIDKVFINPGDFPGYREMIKQMNTL